MKKQSMKKRMRLISALLALILCLLSCPLYAAAEVGESMGDVILPSSTGSGLSSPVEDANALTWTPNDLFLLEAGDKPLSELAEMTLDASSLPEGLSYEQAVASGHVNRVREQEPDLNTVTFQNTNGTKTAYVYTKPVKYIDEMGVVRDKSSAITQQANGGYAMLDNSVKAYFPKNISAGVCIEYEDYSVTMRPITTGMLVPTQSYTEGRVVYANVFGAATLLSYQTTLDGIKEDIILVKNTGQNEFSFMLTPDGVTPVCVDGVWYVKNAENRIIGSFGEVIVKDSVGKTVKGSMTIAQANNASTYTLTVTVPEEYLQAADTQYPVYVDPTMNVYESEMYYEWSDENNDSIIGYYDAIVDIGMNTNLGDSFELRPNQSTGVIYLLHDFYGTYAEYADMPYYQIGNVTLHLTKKSGDDVDLAAFMMYSAMDALVYQDEMGDIIEETIVYDETMQDIYTILLPGCFSPEGTGELTDDGGWVDITYMVKEWAKYNADIGGETASRGVIVYSTSPTGTATIYSTEAAGNVNVYYTIDYASHAGERYIYNNAGGRFINAPTASSTPAKAKATYDDGYNAQWLFEYVGNDQYIIRSVANPNYALCYSDLNLALEEDYVFYETLSNDTGDGRFYWVLGYHISIGTYLKNVATNQIITWVDDESELQLVATSTYTEWQACTSFATSVYVRVNSLNFTTSTWVDIEATVTAEIKTVPENATLKNSEWSRRFIWQTSAPSVATVDQNGNIVGIQKGYAKITATHKQTKEMFTIWVVVGQMLDDGIYQLRNMHSGKYMQIENATSAENAYIEVSTYHDNDHSKWNFSYVGEGYYYIQSIHSEKYLSVSAGSLTDGAAIIQTSVISEACQWKISVSSDAQYVLTPKSSGNTGMALSLNCQNNADGVNLSQKLYTDDDNDMDEWFVYYDASFLGLLHRDTGTRDAFIEPCKNIFDDCETLGKYSSDYSKQEIGTLMENSKIFVIHTHGAEDLFLIRDEKPIQSEDVFDIDDIQQLDLSQVKLIVFLTCQGGLGGYNQENVDNGTPTNLVEACVASGAETVIAFSEDTYVHICNEWIELFFEEVMESGFFPNTVEDSIEPNIITSQAMAKMVDVAVIGGNPDLTMNDIFN